MWQHNKELRSFVEQSLFESCASIFWQGLENKDGIPQVTSRLVTNKLTKFLIKILKLYKKRWWESLFSASNILKAPL